jgi:periplasmic copper chaperone A
MIRSLLCLLALVTASAAEVTVTAAWSRATIAGQEAGAIFALITGGDADDRLLAASSAVASVVEIHEHAMTADGVMQMRQVVGGVIIPAKAQVELKPRSYHIMLIGLHTALIKGSKIPVILEFAQRGKIAVEAEVLDPWAMSVDDR